MHIAILITCFNRRDVTLSCLKRLSQQTGVDDLKIEVFLVDDGSSDGTSEAVERDFPEVHLLNGDGSLYWNGGMRLAFATAMQFDFDGYIWLNDDTQLFPEALQRLLGSYRRCEMEYGSAILVGSLKDPESGKHTYGGLVRHLHGLYLDLSPVLAAPDRILPCDTIHANFSFVPSAVARQIGNFEPGFTHYFGDWDYGFRATKQGVPVRVAPGYYGTCAIGQASASWRDTSLSLAQRWKVIISPKGLPLREWFLYTRRHFGWRWPLYAISPYLKLFIGR
jgi:GT2 family glycosyltransferase